MFRGFIWRRMTVTAPASLLCVAVVLALAVNVLGSGTPVHDALSSLEHAHSMYQEHMAGLKKVALDDILLALVHAETSLKNAKNDRGSSLAAALKETVEAKAELESAKTGAGAEADHLKKVDELVQKAVKHLYQALRQSPAKS